MKRKGIMLLALLAGLCFGGLFLSGNADAASKIKIDKKHFPGKAFREYVRKFDKNKDGYLSKKERKAVRRIELESGKGPCSFAITLRYLPKINLKGIGYFTQTEELKILDYKVENLKFATLKNLKMVDINMTSIKGNDGKAVEKYDFTENKKLREISLHWIGGSVKQILLASDNEVKKLALKPTSNMNKLDLSHFSQVEELIIERGETLESIDLGKCALLKKADISYNKKLTSLDFSGNPNLEKLTAYNNHLTSLDISKNRKLKYLMVDYNYLTKLNVSQNVELREIECSHNLLETLDISTLKRLRTLHCYCLKLKELNLTENLELEQLGCDGNQLETLDLSANTRLLGVSCNANRLETLDLSVNTKLLDVNCGANPLEKLDVSMLPKLTGLSCDYARLTALDVSNNRKLDSLTYAGNRIPFVDLTGHSVRISNSEAVAKMQKSQLLPPVDGSLEEGIPIDKEHFPDYALRYEVLADFDSNHDGILSEKESLIKRPLNLTEYGSASRREIDCTGMEYLKGITEVISGSDTILLNNTYKK